MGVPGLMTLLGFAFLAFASLMSLMFLLGAETLFLALHRLPKIEDSALQKTLSLVQEESGRQDPPPRILVLRDSSPHVFVARSLFSSGVILMSQVLVSSTTEAEMKLLLNAAIERVARPRVIWLSFLSAQLALLLRVLGEGWPRLWLDLQPGYATESRSETEEGTGVARLILFLTFLPWLGFLYRFLSKNLWVDPKLTGSAMRKVRVWTRYHPTQPVLGAFALYLSPQPISH